MSIASATCPLQFFNPFAWYEGSGYAPYPSRPCAFWNTQCDIREALTAPLEVSDNKNLEAKMFVTFSI